MKHREIGISNTLKDFTFEKTLPVNFFFRMQASHREEYMPLFEVILPKKDMMFVNSKWNSCFDLIRNISPTKFKWIIGHTDDSTYFNFLEFYNILQPTVETIINANSLFEKYPEYLI